MSQFNTFRSWNFTGRSLREAVLRLTAAKIQPPREEGQIDRYKAGVLNLTIRYRKVGERAELFITASINERALRKEAIRFLSVGYGQESSVNKRFTVEGLVVLPGEPPESGELVWELIDDDHLHESARRPENGDIQKSESGRRPK